MENIFEILAEATNPNNGLVIIKKEDNIWKDIFIKKLKTKENFQHKLINLLNHEKPFCSRENDTFDEWYNYDLKVIALDFLINYYE